MSELKTCPFCGGEAKVNTLKWVGGYTATALCKNEPNAHYLNTWDEDEAKAVERITEAWNTRHVETCTIGDYKDPDYGYTHDAMWNDEWFVPSGRCSGCGEYIPVWNYCPKCGRKVVDA